MTTRGETTTEQPKTPKVSSSATTTRTVSVSTAADAVVTTSARPKETTKNAPTSGLPLAKLSPEIRFEMLIEQLSMKKFIRFEKISLVKKY